MSFQEIQSIRISTVDNLEAIPLSSIIFYRRLPGGESFAIFQLISPRPAVFLYVVKSHGSG